MALPNSDQSARSARRRRTKEVRKEMGKATAKQHAEYQRRLAAFQKQRARYSKVSAARVEALIERAEQLKAAYEGGVLASSLDEDMHADDMALD